MELFKTTGVLDETVLKEVGNALIYVPCPAHRHFLCGALCNRCSLFRFGDPLL